MLRVKTAVQLALKDAVSRVLTPKKSTDVLREVSISRSSAPSTVVRDGTTVSTLLSTMLSLGKVTEELGENGSTFA